MPLRLVGTRSCAIRRIAKGRAPARSGFARPRKAPRERNEARSQKQQKEASRHTAPDARERIPTGAGGWSNMSAYRRPWGVRLLSTRPRRVLNTCFRFIFSKSTLNLNSEVWILVLVLVVVLVVDQSAFSAAKRVRFSRNYFVQLV